VEGGDKVDIRATSLQLSVGVQAASDDEGGGKLRGVKKGGRMDGYDVVIVLWRTKNGEEHRASMYFRDYLDMCESDDVVECYIIG